MTCTWHSDRAIRRLFPSKKNNSTLLSYKLFKEEDQNGSGKCFWQRTQQFFPRALGRRVAKNILLDKEILTGEHQGPEELEPPLNQWRVKTPLGRTDTGTPFSSRTSKLYTSPSEVFPASLWKREEETGTKLWEIFKRPLSETVADKELPDSDGYVSFSLTRNWSWVSNYQMTTGHMFLF